jgi:TolB-like protein/DNA-binding winged helix-turn-helix (wHTH) protein/Flp pilus assembly protein TadD
MAACEKLRFATFELDTQTHELFRNGRPVKLPPQALRLLQLLATHRGKLVTREEIRREIWSETTFVDFEQGINKSVRQIREVLNDDAERPRFVETLPRRGYRFIAKIEYPGTDFITIPAVDSTPIDIKLGPVTEHGAECLSEQTKPQSGLLPESARSARRWLVIAGAVSILLAIAGLAKMGREWSQEVKPIQSLAVLPLENLSHDAEQEYFADGMTDELITDLAKISALRVISRTSIMQYKGTKKPVSQIARELGVDAVVEGTVTRDLGRVRITAQLIRAVPEKHLWADTYERDVANVLNLQAEVTRAIAQQIRIRVLSDETARLSGAAEVQPAAYEEFLRGRYHFWKNTSDSEQEQAIQHFNRAIQLDPNYASAYGLLSFAWHIRLGNGWVKPGQDGDIARRSALKALDLDPNNPEAHVGLAGVHWFEDWDWAAADKEFKKAMELDPNSSEACGCYIAFLATTGRFSEAIAMGERSARIDPYNAEILSLRAGALYGARRYDEAVRLAQSAADLDQQNSDAYLTLTQAYEAIGKPHEALAAADRDLFRDSALLAWAYARLGRKSDAWTVLARAMESPSDPQGIAQVYFALGDREEGFKWLTRAFDDRENFLSFVKFDPAFDDLHNDPRFRALVARLNMPD